MVSLPEGSEEADANWNADYEDLTFIRDEGLKLLALYRKIDDPRKRQMVIDLIASLTSEDGH